MVLIDLVIISVGTALTLPYLTRHHTFSAEGPATAVSKTPAISARDQTSPLPRATPSNIITPSVLGATSLPARSIGAHPRDIGIFISNVPGEAGSLETIDAIAGLGCTIAYNYNLLDGTPTAIRSYLGYAAAHHVKIIVSLDNLYGSGGETTALQAVRDYSGNSGVWGFGISDEKPEGPADSAQWLPIITDRYHKLKQLTTKPVMAIAVGWSSSNDGQRATFLRSFAPATDVLAIDSYPVPYYASTGIDQLIADGPANRDRWFIAQAFSWASYPDTAKGLGYDLGLARYPTTNEMVSMAKQALAGGATTIMYYSYFDISASPMQLSRLGAAIKAIKTP